MSAFVGGLTAFVLPTHILTVVALGLLAAAGPRAAAAPGEYAQLIESIREGYLLHYAEPRLIAGADWAMPVVVLSAYDEPQMIDAALNAGAANCLKKGVGLDELIDAIRSATVA